MSTVNVFEILGLLVAFGGSMYGMWSNPKRDNRIAKIASIISASGLLIALSLNVIKLRDGKRTASAAELRRQDDVRSAFAGAPLTELDIVWTFPTASAEVKEVMQRSEMMVDTYLLQDDDLSRSAADFRSQAVSAVELTSALGPLSLCLHDGRIDFNKAYEGEDFQIAWRRFQSDSSRWNQDIGTDMRFTGMECRILLPLNTNQSACIALGHKVDDIPPKKAGFGWWEEHPGWFELVNYGFKWRVRLDEDQLQLHWNYPASSLARAVVRSEGAPLTAGLPRTFSLILKKGGCEKSEYLPLIKELKPSASPAEPSDDAWCAQSTIEIVVNGISERKHVYDVRWAGVREEHSSPNLYDGSHFLFSYSRYDCTLKEIK